MSCNVLLTAAHHFVGTQRLYTIARRVERDDKGNILHFGVLNVKIHRVNKDTDWAILVLHNETEQLEYIPISSVQPPSEIDLKMYHSPVYLFNQIEIDVCSPASQKLSLYTYTRKHTVAFGGAFKGSSGAPVIEPTGYVISLHVESQSESSAVETENVSVADSVAALSLSLNSNSQVHASMVKSVTIGKCTTLISELESLGVCIRKK